VSAEGHPATPDVYDRIYELAEPFWQTRSNELHVPASYELAKRLLDALPEADPAIVLPAILLHDTGYSAVPEDDHLRGLAGGPVDWDPDITRLHEIEGARIAGEILAAVGYDPDRTRTIQEIVDGHDSRTEALGLDDAIVKDADKLWRFTEAGVLVGSGWTDHSPEDFRAWLAGRIDQWLFTEPGRRLARELLGA
jgi:HD superfamily phosphodiesterase